MLLNHQRTTDQYMPDYTRVGITSIEVLEVLRNQPWNELAQSYLVALRPSSVRFINTSEDRYDGAITETPCSSTLYRVTVYLNNDGFIKRVFQEVEVGLPAVVENEQVLDQNLEVQRENSDTIHTLYDKDGVRIAYGGASGLMVDVNSSALSVFLYANLSLFATVGYDKFPVVIDYVIRNLLNLWQQFETKGIHTDDAVHLPPPHGCTVIVNAGSKPGGWNAPGVHKFGNNYEGSIKQLKQDIYRFVSAHVHPQLYHSWELDFTWYGVKEESNRE